MKKRIVVLGIILGLLVFATGVGIGYGNRPAVEKVTGLLNKEEDKPASIDFAPFWQVWRLIEEKYVADGKANGEAVSNQEKVWGAASGLVESLGDPYSAFLPPEENKMFGEELSGQFGGVGVEIEKKSGVFVVVSPLRETPAYRAGILAGDVIAEVDGEATDKLSMIKLISLIRGPVGTKVTLKILREGADEPLEFALTRAKIELPILETKILPENIFLITLHNFNAPTSEVFRQAIGEWLVAGTNKLIIDVRNNPGGLLGAAIEAASWFLPKGTPVAIEKHRDGGREQMHRSRGYSVVLPEDYRIIVLVDKGSASSAEIFAAALAENGVATLVGEKTFGKGSVQELIPVSDDTTLKLTVARWFTPKAVSLSENGLEPEIKVVMSEADRKAGRDPQLKKAIEILQK